MMHSLRDSPPPKTNTFACLYCHPFLTTMATTITASINFTSPASAATLPATALILSGDNRRIADDNSAHPDTLPVSPATKFLGNLRAFYQPTCVLTLEHGKVCFEFGKLNVPAWWERDRAWVKKSWLLMMKKLPSS